MSGKEVPEVDDMPGKELHEVDDMPGKEVPEVDDMSGKEVPEVDDMSGKEVPEVDDMSEAEKHKPDGKLESLNQMDAAYLSTSMRHTRRRLRLHAIHTITATMMNDSRGKLAMLNSAKLCSEHASENQEEAS